MNTSRLLAFCVSCFLVSSVGAQAPEAWPTKPITMVVPFPPGGVADAVGLCAPAFMEPSPTIAHFDHRVNDGGRRAEDGEGGS